MTTKAKTYYCLTCEDTGLAYVANMGGDAPCPDCASGQGAISRLTTVQATDLELIQLLTRTIGGIQEAMKGLLEASQLLTERTARLEGRVLVLEDDLQDAVQIIHELVPEMNDSEWMKRVVSRVED